MDIFSSIILGCVEGLTEFIPVSSSGHLIVVRSLLGLDPQGGLAFDAVLQFATILAVLVYFWKDLWMLFMTFISWCLRKPVSTEVEKGNRTLLGAVIIGTIPAVIVGVLLESHLEAWFRGVETVALAMLAGSALMWWAEYTVKKNQQKQLNQQSQPKQTVVTTRSGFIIGLYQCLALIPGVSRSGATISGGMLSGIDRSVATRFSFLLSFPIIVGSGAKKLLELIHTHALSGVGIDLLIASIVAFVVGLASIHFLIRYLKTHTLTVFIWYRVVFALVTLGVIFFVK